MRLIAGDRQTGKSTELIKWLVDGHAIPEYPHWSRVIVVATTSEVEFLDREVKQFGRGPDDEWEPKPYMKCVWHLREFLNNSGAMKYVRDENRVEIAIDNLTHFLGFVPDVATITADDVRIRTAESGNWDSRGQVTTLRDVTE